MISLIHEIQNKLGAESRVVIARGWEEGQWEGDGQNKGLNTSVTQICKLWKYTVQHSA